MKKKEDRRGPVEDMPLKEFIQVRFLWSKKVQNQMFICHLIT